MIDVKKDKTKGMRAVREMNKARVKKWFLTNPGMTVADCARALGLTWQTVKKHVMAIQAGE